MSQKIGPRELALRARRESEAKGTKPVTAPAIPQPSDKKPVKRKRKAKP